MSLAQHTAAISPSRASPGRLDTRALRRTLGAFPTGVTVVTALARSDHALGITVNSFASVSLDPALLLVCIGHGAASFSAWAKSAALEADEIGYVTHTDSASAPGHRNEKTRFHSAECARRSAATVTFQRRL